ncbi:b(0,+)-type amino acid transporter 1-like [Gigantopelta aegis]|uniref:b(0,+)-type amino acid transporter 1-like n=1 Tax=Gigantopelta aegis TaxID=1735272 RepID=UPI001B88C0BA|nr:b(0,+)-type amino acid transporter 1-like [Gigantopelta aegis]
MDALDSDDVRYRGNQNADDSQPITYDSTISLKKQVGLISGVALIAGTMIGSGIFISPTGVLIATGSVGLSMVVWAGCGIIAMLGALTYAELGTLITKSGAEYSYLFEAFGPIPAFLYAWTSVIVTKTSSMAIICLAFAEYVFDPIFDDCGPPEVIKKLLAAAAVVTIAVINCYSVKLASWVQVVFTFIKIAALVIIIVGGFVKLGEGNTQYLAEGFKDSVQSPSVIALAFYDGLWAYDGWNNLNYVTEELVNPYVNLPRAIWIALPLVTVLYLLTNISYLSVMSKEKMISSPAVASTWATRVLGPAAVLVPICVACSTFGAANGTCFTGGRLVYAAAREGHLPEILSYVHVKNYTPLPSLVLTTFIALLMIIPGDIYSLIDLFSFASWLFYGLTFASLVVLRFTKKHDHRPYKVPIIIPILVTLIAIYLVIAPIVQNPKIEFLYAFIFILAGMIFYIPFVHFKLRIRCLDYVTAWLQLVMEVAPSKYEPVV